MTHTVNTVLALFAEANGIVRVRVTGALEHQGFVVFWAASIEEAVSILEAHDIDLLLMDLNLPAKASGEVFRRLNAMSPGIPMIVIAEPGLDFALIPAGRVGAVLERPFRMADLIQAMRGVLNQPGHLSREITVGSPATDYGA